MFNLRFPLKAHAWLVSIILLFLTGMLGAKAYSVARTHFQEMNELVSYDLQAQALVANERSLGKPLEQFRDEKLNQAHNTALGLLRLIIFALLLSAGVTSWLLYLFFRGLIRPLEGLKDATDRIGNGELSCRITRTSGLTELQELSHAFNSMAERLQKLDQAKAEFLAMISHEIKNPLAALKEGLSLLLTRGEALSPTARAKGFEACLIASKRLESMINNLLQHSRMEAGFFHYDMTLKDLSVVIQTAAAEVRPLAEKKGIRFELSQAAAPILATFNSDGMLQVFENLFLNAIKYGAEQSVVEVESERTGEAYRIRVINSGVSIDPAEASRIFDLFYRGSNTSGNPGGKPGAGGMGLGLHVVKTIVEAHRGEVTASSAAGMTTFQLWLPIGNAPARAGILPALKTSLEDRNGPAGLDLAH